MRGDKQFSSLEGAARALRGRAVHLAVGMFDGVHLGHRAVIESAVQSARRASGASAVLTFWPHPSAVLHPERAPRLIMDAGTKARVLEGLGPDAVITQEFTPDFAAIEPEGFIPFVRERLPQLTGIYVGENWRFGKGRRGDIALLVAEGRKQGLTIFSAPRVKLDGEPISSTRIRGLLEAGEVAAANTALGYTYFSEGTVVRGKGLGVKIGFPTLNLEWSPQVRPRLGVYAVQVRRQVDGAAVPGIANYGLRPTVEQATEPRLEVHVLGDCPFGAGDGIVVEWLRFVRPERKFAGVEELKAQIASDIAGG